MTWQPAILTQDYRLLKCVAMYFGTCVHVHSYHTMLHHIQEDSNTHTNYLENLKSNILIGNMLVLSLFPLLVLISIKISNVHTKQPCQVYGSIHK